jgi:hypothetical protein
VQVFLWCWALRFCHKLAMDRFGKQPVSLPEPLSVGDLDVSGTVTSGSVSTASVTDVKTLSFDADYTRKQLMLRQGGATNDSFWGFGTGPSVTFPDMLYHVPGSTNRHRFQASAAAPGDPDIDLFFISGGGNVTAPLTTSFAAHNSIELKNVTGDGTGYDVQCDTTTRDVQSRYVGGGTTPYFSCNHTGTYAFSGEVVFSVPDAAMTSAVLQMRKYVPGLGSWTIISTSTINPRAARDVLSDKVSMAVTRVQYVESGEYINMRLTVSSGAKTCVIAAEAAKLSGVLLS